MLIAFWASFAGAAEPKIINVGWTGGSSWTALPDRIASERGFFEKEGLRVCYIQFQGTNLMLGALLANTMQSRYDAMNDNYGMSLRTGSPVTGA